MAGPSSTIPSELVFPVGDWSPTASAFAADGGGYTYDDVVTRVKARLEGGVLRTPVPRASFHGVALATVLGLPESFLPAWQEANRSARDLAPADAPRLGVQAGEDWWRYTRGRGLFRLAWPAADIAIPDLHFFARRDTHEVYRVLVWPEHATTMVVPEAADLIAVRRDPKLGLAVQPRPAGLVRRETLVRILGARLEPHAQPLPHGLYRGGDDHGRLIAEVWAGNDVATRDLRAVTPDQLVDA